MKPLSIAAAALIAASTLAVPVAASAQSRPHVQAHATQWVSINQRQAHLDQRIDMGARSGALSSREAASLRSQYRQLAALEAQYRRGGLSAWERNDLDRRFNALSAGIRIERIDRDRHRG